MTPRSDIFALPRGVDPHTLATQIAQSRYSRVPIYDGTLDHVVGMIHAFDVIKAGGTGAPCRTNGKVNAMIDGQDGAKTGSPRGPVFQRQNSECKVARHADPRHKDLTVRGRRRSIAAISCLVGEIPG